MKFLEALHHMVAGHRVGRGNWDKKWSVRLSIEDDGDKHFVDEEHKIVKLTAEEVTAEDWELR